MSESSTNIHCPPIPFGNRWIGPSFPVFVIAEIGINHEGDPDQCARLIEAAAHAGADAVKLQIVNADESYVPGTESHGLFKSAELHENDVIRLFNFAKQLGVELFATCGDLASFEWFNRLSPVAYKISSGLLTHTPLIESIAETGKTILMSTGMADDELIEQAMNTAKEAGAEHIGIFQCTSLYPAPPETLNLSAISYLEEKYQVPAGLSDHSLGTIAAPVAVAAGARMIEKHFSMDSSRPGYDHHISLSPDGFAELVRKIRDVEKMLGSAEKILTESERPQIECFHRCIVARRNIPNNKIITKEDIGVMRVDPKDFGLSPYFYKEILGKTAKRDIMRYTPLKEKDYQ